MTGTDKPYAVGKGKPPKEHQFKKGQVANPGGKTSAHAKAERKAGELAAQIQAKMLEHLIDKDPAAMAEALTGADLLRLIKDAMDREYGTAVQKVEAKGGFTVTIASDDADL